MSSPPLERTRRPIDRRFPRLARRLDNWVGAWNHIGTQTKFYGKTLRSVGYVFTHYRIELLRIIAQMGLGTGALVVIGGTVAIVGFLTVTTGALVAVQGYTDFSEIGVEALTGFASAFFNVRLIAPATTAIALAATIGAGATAQLGAMRINEEIDALEVMGIRSVAYLASTRVIAGLVVVIPLYCVGVLASFWAARFGTTVIYGQSTGVYDHYFRTFLNPHRSGLVIRAEHRDGGGDHADPHVLRLLGKRRTRGCGRGGRPGGADLADRRGVRGDDDLARRVRAIRQLQLAG